MADASPVAAVTSALSRWGGALVAPRRTVGALGPDDGTRDGLVLGSLYVIGTSIYPMTVAIATVVSTGSLVALASGVARVLLTPIVVLVLVETLLGSERSYRAGLTLLPMVLVTTIAHALALFQLPSLPTFWPDVAGAAATVGFALWIRSAVQPEKPTESA